MLCRVDIHSPEFRRYFRTYLHGRTDHFIHEFYNFAISAYDIVGYDRNVDYNERTITSVNLSDCSGDDEVQVIEPTVLVDVNNLSNTSPPAPLITTTVVMETSGSQETNCLMTDMAASTDPVQTSETPQPEGHEVVLGSSSSDSECEFVLALKPPHLRTPEMLSLDSASDSDVIFIPNGPEVIARVDSSTTDSEDNKPLAIAMKLKSEVDDSMKEEENFLEPEIQIEQFNLGASTSTDQNSKVKKIYFAPKRKRVSLKNIFGKSSSESSSSSGSSDSSDSESNGSDTHTAKKKRRRVAEKNMKMKRKSSAKNQKPLNLLPSTEEAQKTYDDDSERPPRVKSVIIMKNKTNQHYNVKQKSSNSESSSSES